MPCNTATAPAPVLRIVRRATIVACLAAVFAGLVISLAMFLGYCVVLTPSIPRGVYRISPTPDTILVGSLAYACAPRLYALEAKARGTLGPGQCPGGAMPLIKHVVAVGPATIVRSDSEVVVDAQALPHSGSYPRSRDGSPISHIPSQVYQLRPGQLWLAGDIPQSWDSRYFGPIDHDAVRGIAHPVFVIDRL